MSTELTEIDLAARIRERIRDEFLNLIPDEKWDAFIEKSIREFTTDVVANRGSYNEKVIKAPISTIIDKEVERRARLFIHNRVNALSIPDTEIGRLVQDALTPSFMLRLLHELVGTMLSEGVERMIHSVTKGYKLMRCGNYECRHEMLVFEGSYTECPRCSGTMWDEIMESPR